MHYWQDCPLLMSCSRCQQVVEIATLQEHLLDECERRADFAACPTCGDALEAGAKFEEHVAARSCRPQPGADSGKQRCVRSDAAAESPQALSLARARTLARHARALTAACAFIARRSPRFRAAAVPRRHRRGQGRVAGAPARARLRQEPAQRRLANAAREAGGEEGRQGGRGSGEGRSEAVAALRARGTWRSMRTVNGAHFAARSVRALLAVRKLFLNV